MKRNSTNTEKEKQHYVPKFYLRNFSYQNNKKQVGIFNIKKEFYYSTATIRDVGCKPFFYGKDGEIEDALSDIEGILSSTINKLCITSLLPK